jgi:hypothetical protein
MARIDDYVAAKKMAVEKLASESVETIAARSGFEADGTDAFRVSFLGNSCRVSWPGFDFAVEGEAGKEIPIQEQVLILHYMLAPVGEPSGNWVAYREIPGASFYFSAFVKRAVDPLKKVFGSDASLLEKTAGNLDGRAIDAGDAGFEFSVFPRVPIQLILWEGDEEFPAEANILFDDTIGDLLSPEDIAWLAGMLVYRLMGLARGERLKAED